jgi:hypothetical protein
MFSDSSDELWIFEGFLFEHSAWGALIPVEMDQHGFSGSLGKFHRAGKIL